MTNRYSSCLAASKSCVCSAGLSRSQQVAKTNKHRRTTSLYWGVSPKLGVNKKPNSTLEGRYCLMKVLSYRTKILIHEKVILVEQCSCWLYFSKGQNHSVLLRNASCGSITQKNTAATVSLFISKGATKWVQKNMLVGHWILEQNTILSDSFTQNHRTLSLHKSLIFSFLFCS